MKLKFKDIKKYKPVEISIENKNVHAQIAYLVDSPMFLFDIQSVRDQFHIEKLFTYGDYDSWNNHLFELAGFDSSEIKEINSLGNEEKQEWIDSRIDEHEHLIELRSDYQHQLAKIRMFNRYPPLFDDVIQQAVLFHKVLEFKTTYATIIRKPSTLKGSKNDEHDATLAIILTPNSTKNDVLKAYDEAMKLRPNYELYNPLYIELDSDPDYIERDRLWFWGKYRDDMSSEALLDEWNEKCPKKQTHQTEMEANECEFCSIADVNIVDKAISRYKKKIQFLFKETSDN